MCYAFGAKGKNSVSLITVVRYDQKNFNLLKYAKLYLDNSRVIIELRSADFSFYL